jgi:IS5 family transposase
VKWNVELRPSTHRMLANTEAGRSRDKLEKLKSRVRAKVRHPSHVVKNIFGHKKGCYLGMA